jgi:hypothetical protein
MVFSNSTVLNLEESFLVATELCGEIPGPLEGIEHLVKIRQLASILVEVEIEFDLGDEEIQGTHSEVTEALRVALIKSAVHSCLAEGVSRQIVAGLLARPGCFQALEAISVIDKRFKTHGSTCMALDSHILDLAEELGWPTLVSVSMKEVSTWLHSLKGFTESIGRERFGRAVASLTHIMMLRDSSGANSLWPLVALESLYCKGKDGLQAQIIEKSQVYLGEREGNHKAFKRMYAARSKYVHGQLDYPMAFVDYYAMDEWAELGHGLGDASDLATTILIATLRKAASENRSSLEFEWSLKRLDS